MFLKWEFLSIFKEMRYVFSVMVHRLLEGGKLMQHVVWFPLLPATL